MSKKLRSDRSLVQLSLDSARTYSFSIVYTHDKVRQICITNDNIVTAGFLASFCSLAYELSAPELNYWVPGNSFQLYKVVEKEYQRWRTNHCTGDNREEGFPLAIRDLFLPLAFGDSDDPLVVTGIVLDSDAKASENKSPIWYKGGTYVAESFTTYTLRHGNRRREGLAL